MLARNDWPRLVVLASFFSLFGGIAEGAAVRFHYVPSDSCSSTAMKPTCDVGESRRWFGMVRESCEGQYQPTCIVTFHHPYSGQTISVPLALPEGTPIMLHGPDRVTFNYGSYAVRVRFLPDGSVDVVYDSGFLRAP
jgi:hypothetical protein